MARPNKEGLDYFPFDVDADQDDKIAMIEALHGLTGFGIVVKLLMKIYKEGYCYEWNKREPILLHKKVNVDINVLNEIIKDCLAEGLFHKEIFFKYSFLTSNGIQKRYLEAIKRRKEVSFQRNLFLLDEETIRKIVGTSNISIYLIDEDGNKVNVNINPVNEDISTQSKERVNRKESKEDSLSNSGAERMNILQTLNYYKVQQDGGVRYLEDIESYQGLMDDELILDAIKRSYEKTYSFCRKVLSAWNAKGYKRFLDNPENQVKQGGGEVAAGRMGESRGRRQGAYENSEYAGGIDVTGGQTGRIKYPPRE